MKAPQVIRAACALVFVFCLGQVARAELLDDSGRMRLDPFDGDQSPRAQAFRKSWRQAIEEGARLEPLPDGVSGEEQRKKVVETYEKAIAIMPEAPPCASFLERVGRIWSGTYGEAPPEPDRAIEAYQRLLREYPNAHEFVMRALGGIANSEFLRGDAAKATARAEELIDYRLPEDAPPELVSFAARYKKATEETLRMYRAAAAGFYTVKGKMVVPGMDELIAEIVADVVPEVPEEISNESPEEAAGMTEPEKTKVETALPEGKEAPATVPPPSSKFPLPALLVAVLSAIVVIAAFALALKALKTRKGS